MRDEVFRMSVQQFRSAAFGGFNKQDVLNYIETTNREHAAALESLKKELEEARTGTAGLEERAAAAEKRADDAAARAEQLSGNLRACAASLELARAEVGRRPHGWRRPRPAPPICLSGWTGLCPPPRPTRT